MWIHQVLLHFQQQLQSVFFKDKNDTRKDRTKSAPQRIQYFAATKKSSIAHNYISTPTKHIFMKNKESKIVKHLKN